YPGVRCPDRPDGAALDQDGFHMAGRDYPLPLRRIGGPQGIAAIVKVLWNVGIRETLPHHQAIARQARYPTTAPYQRIADQGLYRLLAAPLAPASPPFTPHLPNTARNIIALR